MESNYALQPIQVLQVALLTQFPQNKVIREMTDRMATNPQLFLLDPVMTRTCHLQVLSSCVLGRE